MIKKVFKVGTLEKRYYIKSVRKGIKGYLVWDGNSPKVSR